MNEKLKNKGWNYAGLKGLGRSYWGMVLGHIGAAITVVGMAMVSNYTLERDVRLVPGGSAEAGDYRFEMVEVKHVDGPNWTADQAEIRVYLDDDLEAVMYPQKRRYIARNQVMTEAAIDWGIFRDIYVAMGEPLEGDAWAMRVQHKPYVRWLWIGGVIMTLGGLLAALDKRYRRMAAREVKAKQDIAHPEAKDNASSAEGATV